MRGVTARPAPAAPGTPPGFVDRAGGEPYNGVFVSRSGVSNLLDLQAFFQRAGHWLATRPTHTRVLLAVATTMLVIELLLRNVAPQSRLYAKWTAIFLAIGKV